MSSRRTCECLTQKGLRCKFLPTPGEKYCYLHKNCERNSRNAGAGARSSSRGRSPPRSKSPPRARSAPRGRKSPPRARATPRTPRGKSPRAKSPPRSPRTDRIIAESKMACNPSKIYDSDCNTYSNIYRTNARKCHPDKFSGESPRIRQQVEDVFKRFTNAKDIKARGCGKK